MTDPDLVKNMLHSEFTSKPLLNLQNGDFYGKPTGLLVNPKLKRVEFLLIGDDTKTDDFEVLVARFDEIVGKGDFALTIQDQSKVRRIVSPVIYQTVFADFINIHRMPIKSGSCLVGYVMDYSIDENTGEIKSINCLNLEQKQSFIKQFSINNDVILAELD